MEEKDDLKNKVGKWLSQEGYALEFFTASKFLNNGFKVMQGDFVRDDYSNSVREIDVTAYRDIMLGDNMLGL